METAHPIPLVAPRDQLAFFDSKSMELPQYMTALEAWGLAMQQPIPGIKAAMWLRDKISGLFGVPPIHGVSHKRVQSVKPGDKLDFFLVEYSAENLLVLTVRDTHLDVMTTVTTYDRRFTITSSVITHNWFGRAYMIPVGPAHRLIVWFTFRRLCKSISLG